MYAYIYLYTYICIYVHVSRNIYLATFCSATAVVFTKKEKMGLYSLKCLVISFSWLESPATIIALAAPLFTVFTFFLTYSAY